MQDGGLPACTAPAVAAHAGVAVGTIYRRYADKDALVAAAVIDLVSLGGGDREAEYLALAEEAADLADFLRRVTATAVDVAHGRRTLVLAVRAFSRTYGDPNWRRRFDAEQGRARDCIVKAAMSCFGQTVRGGEPALRLSLAAIYGAVEAIWLEPLAGLFVAPPDPVEVIDGLVDMQMRYLARQD
jgi:AcrR family transcriptional regulator